MEKLHGELDYIRFPLVFTVNKIILQKSFVLSLVVSTTSDDESIACKLCAIATPCTVGLRC